MRTNRLPIRTATLTSIAHGCSTGSKHCRSKTLRIGRSCRVSSARRASRVQLAAQWRTVCCAGWVNYLLLPEVINREWNGQGLISWARVHVYAPIKRRCDGVRNTRVAVDVVPLQARSRPRPCYVHPSQPRDSPDPRAAPAQNPGRCAGARHDWHGSVLCHDAAVQRGACQPRAPAASQAGECMCSR